MKFVRLPKQNVEISIRPITTEVFLRSRHGNPSRLITRNGVSQPITGVSATDAREFAARLGGRLPTKDELVELAALLPNMAIGFACSTRECLSEWLRCEPENGSNNHSSNCILNPSWLRRQNGASTHGAIPNRPHSFVTFRLVRGSIG